MQIQASEAKPAQSEAPPDAGLSQGGLNLRLFCRDMHAMTSDSLQL
jgi:hypothetical protein